MSNQKKTVTYLTEMIERLSDSTLVDIYADEGISGRSTAKREDFNRLIADCKKGRIDRIITKSVSRFARNTVDCLQTVRTLSKLGVTVCFEKEHIDTAYMTSEVLLALSGTQAQDESISHGNNMRWSYINAMKSGNFLGTIATYGYTLIDRGTVSINEDEAAVVRMIKDMYLSGMGLQKNCRLSEYAQYQAEKQEIMACLICQVCADQRTVCWGCTPSKKYNDFRISAEKNTKRRIATAILCGELPARHIYQRRTNCHPYADRTARDQGQKNRRPSAVKDASMR